MFVSSIWWVWLLTQTITDGERMKIEATLSTTTTTTTISVHINCSKIFDTVHVMGQILLDLFFLYRSSWNSYKQLHCDLVQRFIALDVCRCCIVYFCYCCSSSSFFFFSGECKMFAVTTILPFVAFWEQYIWWWSTDSIIH